MTPPHGPLPHLAIYGRVGEVEFGLVPSRPPSEFCPLLAFDLSRSTR
jgi:hypothetical protein